ncbi:MAG: hypothetical protein ABII00_15735 [Elusimicrobiota bacterium]
MHSSLKTLEGSKAEYGGEAASRKLRLLRDLERRRLSRPREVFRLHEILCFLRAYPDDEKVLRRVERMLDAFDRRADLRRHRRALADTGIAGTPIRYSFFWSTARWLTRRWPERLTLDWSGFEKGDALVELLALLLPYNETLALDETDLTPRQWVRLLKGPDETDAAFLIRRFERLPADDFGREKAFDDLDLRVVLSPGPDTPSRTRAKVPGSSVAFQAGPLSRSRPDLRREVLRRPRVVRPATPDEARRLIFLARCAMATRERDLYVFEHADPEDVRLVEAGPGLWFAFIGTACERRLLLESNYGCLTLKNGVPIGYALVASLFNSSEVAFNTFETFRGAESAFVFARLLAASRALFGADSFTLDPFQIGDDNPEALKSGAWWFYQKLGFAPLDAGTCRLMRRELARMKKDPRHRSDIATLKELASEGLFLQLAGPRPDVMGRIALGGIGRAIVRYVAARFGSAREAAQRTCSREAAKLLGLRSLRGFSKGERQAWTRWSPLVLALPGVERWSLEQRKALARVVRAKGGRRESDFVALFDRHRKLRRAILKLAEGG